MPLLTQPGDPGHITVSVPVPTPMTPRPQPQQPQPEQQPAPQPQRRPAVQPWRNPPAAVLLPADEGGQAGPQQMRRAGRPRQYMESEHTGFHNAILAAPKDDAPKLVYADYLDENDSPAAAQVFRTQPGAMGIPAHSLKDRSFFFGSHRSSPRLSFMVGTGKDPIDGRQITYAHPQLNLKTTKKGNEADEVDPVIEIRPEHALALIDEMRPIVYPKGGKQPGIQPNGVEWATRTTGPAQAETRAALEALAGAKRFRRAGRPLRYALASGWIAPNNVFHPLAEGELHGDFAARHLGVPDRAKAFDQLHRTGWVRVAAPGHFGQSIYKITTRSLRSSGPRDRIHEFLQSLPANQEVQVGDESWQNHRGPAYEVARRLFDQPERMARIPMTAQTAKPAHWRAPAGGMVVRGNYYQGGKLVPGEATGKSVKPKTRKMAGFLRDLKNALIVKYAESEDDAFRNAIDEAPHDDAPKLVYADYLDEHGRESEANIWREMTQEKGDEDLHPKGWMLESEVPEAYDALPNIQHDSDALFDELTTGRRHREFPAHTFYVGSGSARRRAAYVSSPTTPENQSRTKTYLDWADLHAHRSASHIEPVVAVRTSPRQNRHPLVNAAIGTIPRGFGPVGIQHIVTAHGDYLAGKPTELADLMHQIQNPVKPVSKAAHDTLTFHGWTTRDGSTYRNPSLPGHQVTIQGHVDRGGGRKAVSWTHTEPSGNEIQSHGDEALSYHLHRVAQRG